MSMNVTGGKCFMMVRGISITLSYALSVFWRLGSHSLMHRLLYGLYRVG